MILKQVKVSQRFLLLPRLAIFFPNKYYLCYWKLLFNFKSSKKVDFDSVASVLLAFMEEEIFGSPKTTITDDINHTKVFILSTDDEVYFYR